MRLLGFAIVAALLALGVFLFLGYNEPEFSYTAQVEVTAPVEDSWAVFSDESKMPLWLTGFVKVEYLRGEPNQVGSFYRLTFEEDGQQFLMTEEVTALVENDRFGMTLEADMMIAETLMTFRAVPQGTLIVSENTVRGKSAFWRSMLLLSRGEMQRRHQADLEKLKTLIETT